jgi:hypothetical protein
VTVRRREYSGCFCAALAAASVGRVRASMSMPPGILPRTAPRPPLVAGLQRRGARASCLTFHLGDLLAQARQSTRFSSCGSEFGARAVSTQLRERRDRVRAFSPEGAPVRRWQTCPWDAGVNMLVSRAAHCFTASPRFPT